MAEEKPRLGEMVLFGSGETSASGRAKGLDAFAIVCDSSHDLPPAVAQNLHLTVVPYTINFGVDSSIDARGFARCRWQVECLGPSTPCDTVGKHGLPRKWAVWCPQRVEELAAGFRLPAPTAACRHCERQVYTAFL